MRILRPHSFRLKTALAFLAMGILVFAGTTAGQDPGGTANDYDGDGVLNQGAFGPAQVFYRYACTQSCYGTGRLTVADLDGDGDTDVLWTGMDHGGGWMEHDLILWQRNTDGLGNFGGGQTIASGDSVEVSFFGSVEVVDLDGDGDLDVLSASSQYRDSVWGAWNHTIQWYENTDGLGSFGDQQVITTAVDSPYSVHAADLDGDGDIDVVSGATWYENTDGLGSFGAQQMVEAADAFGDADLDGDGDLDLLSASSDDNKISWHENTDGLGSFGPQQVIATGVDHVRSVYAADLDGDGDLDVLSYSGRGLGLKIAWYENTNGLASFGAEQVITTGVDVVFAGSPAAVDLDGDGDLDVLSGFMDIIEYDGRQFEEFVWYENVGFDNCPNDANTDQANSDGDARGDACDDDIDGDGVLNADDAFPNDSSESIDSDQDGVGDNSDVFPDNPTEWADSDSDGVGDNADDLPNDPTETLDTDGDGIGNNADDDDDGDNWSDTDEAACGTNALSDESIPTDTDSDLQCDVLDADDDGDNWSDTDEAACGTNALSDESIPTDTDSDLQCDVLDVDDDGDGVSDAVEGALGTDPLDPDTDGDGADDGNELGGGTDPLNAASFPDEDADGVTDQQDNCPHLATSEYEDADGNGTGDACNDAEDRDGDDWADDLDNCPNVPNPNQTETNGSGSGDACDPDRDLDGVPNQGNFGPQQVITNAADGASAVYAADLDGDGDMDVLSASARDHEIAFYENTDGLGSFGSQQVITTAAHGAIAVYTTDLDGDGDTDVLSASVHDDTIAWYRNRNSEGLGSFSARQVITTAADGAWSVHAADLDGDGDMDVLSASYNDDKVAWYENTDGLGSFGAQQILTTAADVPRSVYAADLDGDGDMDVLSASSDDNKIAWYENTDGLGSFSSQQVITTEADNAFSVHAADLDGDGDMDVLSASSDDDKIAWYENIDGLGSFGDQQVITTAADGANFVGAADLDGDGDIDVLSTSEFGDKITLHQNTDGLGNFDAQQVITTAADGAVQVGAADLNGDGNMDVLSASFFDDKIAWYENISFDNCPDNFNPNQTDTDGNGVGDACNSDEDSDDDERADDLDNCTNDANTDQADTDNNGIGDACNSAEDSDDDEFADALDNCPSDFNPDQANSDGDARGDACDAFPSNPAEVTDTDGDGTGNNADADDDNDGLSDAIEAGLGTDPLNPDTDGDGYTDGFDNCRTDANADQANLDGDLLGDVCDDDRDGDETANESDAFPDDASESADSDGDEIGDNADPCFNGTTQTGTTTCGLNSEGFLTQTCTTGGWIDNGAETCTGTDICVNGTGQAGTTTCGLNSEGVLTQTCTTGGWVDNGAETCTGTDICVNGATEDESCGLNARGTQTRTCTTGAWGEYGTCTDPDVCTDGGSQAGPTACGLNNEGTLTQTCTTGGWVDDGAETCTGTDVCVNGSEQTGTTVCGLADEGFLFQACSGGAWVNGDECSSNDADGDGFTDAEEITAGTDPLDINSIPAPEPTSVLLQLTALLTLAGLRRRTPRQ